ALADQPFQPHTPAKATRVVSMTLLRMTFRKLVIVGLFSSGLATGLSHAADSSDTNAVWLAEHYTKYEHMIPMRDGVRLLTRVYVPKDDSDAWPIMLTRTPYSLKP